MSNFNYTALEERGSYIKGSIKSFSRKRAIRDLEKKGLLIISTTKEKKFYLGNLNKITTISLLDKIFFTKHLLTVLESGISIDEATKIAAEQTTNHKFREIIEDIHNKIRKGQTFHYALSQHKKYFSNFFINLVKVGEKSGTLEDSLNHLLEQQERDYELITKARGAMIYPLIITIAAIIIVSLMMAFVVPTVTGILLEYSVELPLPTKILIFISNFLANNLLFVISTIIILFLAGYRLTKTKKGKWIGETILLNTPIIKHIVIEFNLARFTRAMSALLKSGIVIDEALELASDVCKNSHYKVAVAPGVGLVRRGIPLTEILKGNLKLFPPIATRMIEVGEKTGKLDHMYDRIAKFYEKSVLNTLNNLSSIIEPVLLLLIGCGVAFVAVSILTPIWKFVETID